MDFIILDLNNASEQTLIECIEKNTMIAKTKRDEIARLQQLTDLSKNKIIVDEPEEEITSPTETSKETSEEFEDEVDYYYESIHSLTTSSLVECIEDFLPTKEHPYYDRLMYRLYAEILREIKDIKDFIGTEELTEEELAELKSEIEISKLKISKIKELLSERDKEEEKTTIKRENDLIFISTSTGRVRVFDELESMPPEYYDELFELFSSIKNGTFKGVKRFQGANYARTSEVKGKLMRVVFDRIGKNSYAIITAFAKKFDTSTAYRTSLESAIQSYIPMRETIMGKLSDDEFINMHKEFELDLMRRLSPTKQPQYIKAKEASHE